MRIDNQPDPTQPKAASQPIHAKHFFLHLLTFCAALAAGVGADKAFREWEASRPRRVRWANGQLEIFKAQVRPLPAAEGRTELEIGALEDGTVVWRLK